MDKILLMKIYLFILALFLFGGSLFAQSHSGLNLGYLSTYPDGKTSTGFYAGFYYNAEITGDVSVQPAINYGRAGNANLLYLPVMLKFYWPDTDYNFQIGPQGTYILNDYASSSDRLGMDLNIGLGYDILYNVFINARYGFKLIDSADVYPQSDFNTFNVGIGFSFW